MTAFRTLIDRMRGTGSASVTVPVMDGPLKPNTLLDKALVVAELGAPVDLVRRGPEILTASGTSLLTITRRSGTRPELVQRLEHDITALASHSDGTVAVALSDGSIQLIRPGSEKPAPLGPRPGIPCITAMAFADGQTLIVCSGSTQHPRLAWKRDLMSLNALGSIWRVNTASGAQDCLADGLAFPHGVLPRPEGLVITESWRHRLLLLQPGKKPYSVADDLPGYPARLAAASDGGLWVPLFAPRRQMVEFVLSERAYCRQMMEEIPEEYWMAPSMSTGSSYLEPLMGGAIRQLGVLKPWAPTRSYGMLVKMNEKFEPVASLHSRADGKWHGITSCLEFEGAVLAASEGGNAIISSDLAVEKAGVTT